MRMSGTNFAQKSRPGVNHRRHHRAPPVGISACDERYRSNSSKWLSFRREYAEAGKGGKSGKAQFQRGPCRHGSGSIEREREQAFGLRWRIGKAWGKAKVELNYRLSINSPRPGQSPPPDRATWARWATVETNRRGECGVCLGGPTVFYRQERSAYQGGHGAIGHRQPWVALERPMTFQDGVKQSEWDFRC